MAWQLFGLVSGQRYCVFVEGCLISQLRPALSLLQLRRHEVHKRALVPRRRDITSICSGAVEEEEASEVAEEVLVGVDVPEEAEDSVVVEAVVGVSKTMVRPLKSQKRASSNTRARVRRCANFR